MRGMSGMRGMSVEERRGEGRVECKRLSAIATGWVWASGLEPRRQQDTSELRRRPVEGGYAERGARCTRPHS